MLVHIYLHSGTFAQLVNIASTLISAFCPSLAGPRCLAHLKKSTVNGVVCAKAHLANNAQGSQVLLLLPRDGIMVFKAVFCADAVVAVAVVVMVKMAVNCY